MRGLVMERRKQRLLIRVGDFLLDERQVDALFFGQVDGEQPVQLQHLAPELAGQRGSLT